jgi:uncharacterized protein (DUF58 family)
LIASAIALAFFAGLFQDVLILATFLVLLAIIMGEAIWLVYVERRAPLLFRFLGEPSDFGSDLELYASLHPGESSTSEIYFLREVNPSLIRIVSTIGFLKFMPNAIPRKNSQTLQKINAEFKSPFSGIFKTDSVGLVITSPLKLFSASADVRAKIQYRVFPVVIEVAISTLDLFGKLEIGETALETPGRGTEFYELRKYVAGDEDRQINWKATARVGELMVNERMREVGATYLLVLDARALDYFDRDRLAATFLTIANSLSRFNAQFGVIVHDGRKIIVETDIAPPERSLRVALEASLDFAKIKRDSIPEILSAVGAGKFRTSESALRKQGLALLSQIEEIGRLNLELSVRNAQSPYGAILKQVREKSFEGKNPSVLYVSGIFDSMSQIVELGLEIRSIRNSEFILANPAMRWISAAEEKDAYEFYKDWEKKLAILRNAGINYNVGEPTQIAEAIFQPRVIA